ncbi:MAG: hypothetical protein H7Y31_01760 [Chitinophagaceae bacterium]|nr:hypothetical protein [Chitinophagaceae bacterium]
MKKVLTTLILLLILSIANAQDYRLGSKVQGRWGGYWHKGTIIEIKDDKYKVHYDGYGVGYDEWLTREQFRTEADKKSKPIPQTAVFRPAVDSVKTVAVKENTPKAAVPVVKEAKVPVPITSREKQKEEIVTPSRPTSNPTKKVADTVANKPVWVSKPGTKTATTPPTPPMVGDKIYLRTVLSGNTAVITVFYLGKNDVIVRNPRNGLSPIDIAAEQKNNAQNIGTYKIEGDQFRVQWKDGKTTSWKCAYSPVVIYGLDGGIVSLIKPMPNGYSLSGTYTALGIADDNSSSQFDFKFDGSFKVSGALYASTNAGTDKGKYTINGNTLQLFFENGKTSKTSICQALIGTKKFLVINNVSYPLN